MSLVQLFVPAEVAHDTVAELGELGNVEFKDVSSFHALFLSSLTQLPHSAAQPECEPLPTFFCRRNPSYRRDGTSRALLRNPDRARA